MGRLAISQLIDNLAQIGQRLIDHVGLLQQFARGPSFLYALRSGQVDQVELAGLLGECF